jgi:hypothetical protein
VFTTTNGILASLGLFQSVAGVAGGTGSVGTGASIIALASIPLTSGAAGAGRATASATGGDITGAGNIPTISGGTTATTIDGQSGYITIRPNEMVSQPAPFVSTGGSGGGSTTAATTGGNGGNGQIGSGGGGAGSGASGIASGGRGGDGVVIITCY